MRRGCSSRASGACAAKTTSSTSTSGPAGRAERGVSTAACRPGGAQRVTLARGVFDRRRRRGGLRLDIGGGRARLDAHPRRREDQAKGGALADLARDVELATMPLHDVLDDREAEAGAARF